MKIFLALVFVIFLSSCLNRSENFKVGDCINAVDGNQIWKVTKNDSTPLQGVVYESSKWTNGTQEIPQRIYTKVPCPK